MIGVRLPIGVGKGFYSLRHRVQTGSGAHPATCPMGTGSKATRGWNWPLTSILCWGYGAIPPLSHTYSWRST